MRRTESQKRAVKAVRAAANKLIAEIDRGVYKDFPFDEFVAHFHLDRIYQQEFPKNHCFGEPVRMCLPLYKSHYQRH